MNHKYLFLICLAVACAKQPATDEAGNVPAQVERAVVSFEASRQAVGDVKSYIDGVTPVWDSNDSLSVFGPSGTNDVFTATSVNGSKAVFNGTSDADGPYTAIYPYKADNTVSGTSATVTIPAVQQLTGGRKIAFGAMTTIATASSASAGLAFKNVTAVLKLTITAEGVTSLLIASDGAPLAGKVAVNTATADVESVVDGTSIVTLLPEGATFTPGDYYVAILPCSSEGLTVSVRHTEDARRGEKSSLKTFKANRNALINVGSFSDGDLDWAYRIYNRKDLDDYAADSANWSIEEDINVCADIDMECKPWHTLDDRLSVYGTFEGNGHCIYNIVIEESAMQYVAFFGRYYKNICNLTLGSKDGVTYDGVSTVRNSYAADNTAWTYTAGCIVWPAEKRIIENVKNFCSVTTTIACTHKSRTAGVVTWIESAEGVVVRGCRNYGKVTVEANEGSDSNVNCGGIVSGVNTTNVLIEDCHNYGPVTSAQIYTRSVGGVVGQTYSGASLTMKNCTNQGEVSIVTNATHKHDAMVGGIIGKPTCKAGADQIKVYNCVNNGRVYSNAVYYSGIGGIAGWAYGADIRECVNNAEVVNNSGSGRYQGAGGIVGICGEEYGTNTIKDCTNNGDVLLDCKSFGYTANSSSGTLRGVGAGGIAGMVYAGTDEISGNVNYGNVTGINGYAGTKSYPKAYMFTGGIVGYDFDKIGLFDNNTNMASATITSRVTDTGSSYTNGYAVAGGLFGYQKYTTVVSGISLGTIVAACDAGKGLVYAGSVVGWSKKPIEMCYYAGHVNGADADATNIVGEGNAPVASAPASASQTDTNEGGLGNVGTETVNWD